MRYGVDQCIGDTIGPGGIFKALRTGPVCSRSWPTSRGSHLARGSSTTATRCRS
ncbi:MAG TPA: hypothetical protein VN965_06815 [Candidatus Dormibacteraeota bacterium]|nr:hypothetical protein [Candidatus Dormibacteraeota bacterium]